jgi:hypothetical protein
MDEIKAQLEMRIVKIYPKFPTGISLLAYKIWK